MRKESGSLTIFAALSIMLIAAVLFTLLEAGRTIELKKIAQWNSDSVIESMFTRYQNPMWDYYHLLGMQCSGTEYGITLEDQKAFIKEITENNFAQPLGDKKSINLLRANLKEAQCSQYILLTDENGEVYKNVIAEYMKRKLAITAVEDIFEQCSDVQELVDDIGEPARKREAVKKLEQETKESQSSAKTIQDNEEEIDRFEGNNTLISNDNNPINQVEAIEKKGILSLVIERDAAISSKAINYPEKLLSRRKQKKGIGECDCKQDAYDKVLMDKYFLETFNSFVKEEGDTLTNKELEYEIEYIIGGKSSDYDNLKNVVERLVQIREVANLGYLLTDGTKIAQAQSLAISLAGATANPVVIEVVKMGILASWAYAESILDVRLLLKGGKISIVKTPQEWTTDISNIGTINEKFITAKECTAGMDYSQYLFALLMIQSTAPSAYRALDITELGIQKVNGYEQTKLDQMVVQLEMVFDYEWTSVFLGLVSIGNVRNHGFKYSCNSRYSYIQ